MSVEVRDKPGVGARLVIVDRDGETLQVQQPFTSGPYLAFVAPGRADGDLVGLTLEDGLALLSFLTDALRPGRCVVRLRCAFCPEDGRELRAGLDVHGMSRFDGPAMASPSAAVVVCLTHVGAGADWLAATLLADWLKDGGAS